MAAWNPITLTYSNPQSERAYVAESAAARIGLDFYAYCASLILSNIPLDGEIGAPFYTAKVLASSILAPILIYLCIRQRATHIAWRDVVIFLLPLVGIAYLCIREQTLAPPSPELEQILSRLSKSPQTVIIFYALAFPLRFRQQVILNLFCIAGVVFWSATFCQSCDAGEEDFSSIFEFLGDFNMNVVSIISLNGIGAFMPKQDCFSVVMFSEISIGFLIPLYIMYNIEVSSRAAFLSKNAEVVERIRIHNLRGECQSWSVWVFMGLLILVGMLCH